MIEIHHSFGFNMAIMAMGAFAADSVRSTFNSYKGTNTIVSYVGMQNLAAISYISTYRYLAIEPIRYIITNGEFKINEFLGMSVDVGTYIEYR